jgi:hypothetical protein
MSFLEYGFDGFFLYHVPPRRIGNNRIVLRPPLSIEHLAFALPQESPELVAWLSNRVPWPRLICLKPVSTSLMNALVRSRVAESALFTFDGAVLMTLTVRHLS